MPAPSTSSRAVPAIPNRPQHASTRITGFLDFSNKETISLTTCAVTASDAGTAAVSAVVERGMVFVGDSMGSAAAVDEAGGAECGVGYVVI